jgi:hypothetical protein
MAENGARKATGGGVSANSCEFLFCVCHLEKRLRSTHNFTHAPEKRPGRAARAATSVEDCQYTVLFWIGKGQIHIDGTTDRIRYWA